MALVHFHVFTNSQARQLEEQLRIMDQTLKALMAAEEKVLETTYLCICEPNDQVFLAATQISWLP